MYKDSYATKQRIISQVLLQNFLCTVHFELAAPVEMHGVCISLVFIIIPTSANKYECIYSVQLILSG